MAMEPPPEMIESEDLTDADEAILDELREGARTKKAIVEATGLHRNTVGNRLNVLEAGDAIRCVHDSTALYELVEDPREDVSAGTAVEETEIEIQRKRVEELAEQRDELESQMDCVRSGVGAALDALEGEGQNLDRARVELTAILEEVLEDDE